MKKILNVFALIDDNYLEVNKERKRMISIKFIIVKLLDILGVYHNNIKLAKSNKKLMEYEKYWEKVQSLIGDKIQSIIDV